MSPPRPTSWRPLARHGRAVLLVLALSPALPAAAQKMYRCGSNYQDRPCAGADNGKVVGSAAPAKAGPALSARCGRRGAAAARLMWARESGLTQEQQQAKVHDPLARELLPEVYGLRGNTADVRAAIEQACTEEEERLHELEASGGVAPAPGQKGMPPPPAAPAETVTPATAASPSSLSGQASDDAERRAKQRRCHALDARMESIRSSQRTGGSAALMDSLNRQARDVSEQRSRAGC